MQPIPLHVLRCCLILVTISILFRDLFYWHWLNCFSDSEIYLKHTFKCIKWDLDVRMHAQHNKVHFLWSILWYHLQKPVVSTSLSTSNDCLLLWKCWMFWDSMHCISFNFKLFTNKLQRRCKQHLKDSTKKLGWKLTCAVGNTIYILRNWPFLPLLSPPHAVSYVCEHQTLASDRERYDCLPGDGWGG